MINHIKFISQKSQIFSLLGKKKLISRKTKSQIPIFFAGQKEVDFTKYFEILLLSHFYEKVGFTKIATIS